jgi:phage terminase large subunit-like protein
MAPKEVLHYWSDWNKKHPDLPLDPKVMEIVRRRCQTEHAFLAQCLGYSKFDPSVHGEMWKFFVQKDPDVQPFEKFATADTSTHDRALFLPRNGYKSTGNMVDVVQYVICWPDIAILIVTGKEDLGRDFIGEIRRHFERQDSGEPRIIEEKFSVFQLAFPEFCVNGGGPKDSFTVPCRKAINVKEETVQFAGVETSMSGPHFDVIIFDDAITNENSKTASRLITIRNQIAYHRKMMNPYGFCNYIGTWYSPQDHYGFLIRAEEENKTLFWNQGRADSHDVEGRESLTKILLRPAMWPKGDKDVDVDGALSENDWTLWFPGRLTWKWLMKELSTNRELFHSQLMNNPNLSKSVKFSRDRLVQQTKLFTELPDLHSDSGVLVQSWDTTYSDSKWANYTVGLTALILKGRYYFVDMVRGQYNDFDLPRVMAQSMAKWRPQRVVIEDANGVRWLARQVRDELKNMNFVANIEFAEISNVKNRKMVLAAPVSKLLSEERIILSNAIPNLEALYTEFEGFMNGAPNDDIVDSMSVLVNYFQYVPEASSAALVQDLEDESSRRRNHSLYNYIFGKTPTQFGLEDQSENLPAEQLPSWVTYSPLDAFR